MECIVFLETNASSKMERGESVHPLWCLGRLSRRVMTEIANERVESHRMLRSCIDSRKVAWKQAHHSHSRRSVPGSEECL